MKLCAVGMHKANTQNFSRRTQVLDPGVKIVSVLWSGCLTVTAIRYA